MGSLFYRGRIKRAAVLVQCGVCCKNVLAPELSSEKSVGKSGLFPGRYHGKIISLKKSGFLRIFLSSLFYDAKDFFISKSWVGDQNLPKPLRSKT